MSLTRKEIMDIFDNIKRGQAILLLGQAYLKKESSYYNRLLKNLRIRNEDRPTLNELWKKYQEQNNIGTLKNAMQEAGNDALFLPWLRAVLSMGWNAVYASTTNIEWILSSVGNSFSVNVQDRNELENSRTNIRRLFNKKNMPLIPLFGNEKSLPENKQEFYKMKNLKELFVSPCENILSQYGTLIIDGLEIDDWIDIKVLQQFLQSTPSDCVYIFGLDKKKLETMCQSDEEALYNILNALDASERKIQLCEKTLKEVVEELGLTDEYEFDDDDHSGEVRISIGEDDTLWVERSECILLQNMGITLLRDELMGSLDLRRRDISEEFSNFLLQDSAKGWNYFNVADEKIKSFHIKRKVEDRLMGCVITQLGKAANERNIILLKGQSNSGKSTTLCWLAREMYERKKSGEKYAVLYINGDPATKNSKWMEDLTRFIKKIYDKTTVKDKRVSNVIIIWDNENNQNRWENYVNLNVFLNDRNIVLIGSIYEFETRTFKQGNRLQEVHISPVLDIWEKNNLNKLIRTVYPNLDIGALEQNDNYLFKILTEFAEYNYSLVWDAYKNRLRAKLEKEANQTENVSNQELYNFLAVREEVRKKGIGAFQQLKIEEMDGEDKEHNAPLRNIIADLNKILAVAGQFNKTVALPESLLLRTVLQNGDNLTIHREIDRIRKILKLDSMVKYESNSETGIRYVSFRHSSEAAAYLDNTFGVDSGREENIRKDKEIEVLKRLITNCDWETTTGIPEAMAVTALIRCFGANSYGKYGEEYNNKGQYKTYLAYWEEIADELYKYAGNNPDAILIVGHFTRELIQQNNMGDELSFANGSNDDLERLDDVYCMMREIVHNDCSPSQAAVARLYGEMCRNILEQMNILGTDSPKSDALCEEFINNFRDAVKITNECNRNNHKIGTILLLDIWLNFALAHELEQYLPDTLEYIESLMYDEGDFIEENNDIANVIGKINKVYELISEPDNEKFSKLKGLLTNKGNDSWVYFQCKQELVKVYDMFKGDNTASEKNCFGSENGLSPRVFFLNEYAADDFNTEEDKKLFVRIKYELKKASKKIIEVLKGTYQNDLERMSFRCLRMYLQSKWMYYTGNLMLEYDQRPGLSYEQWNELYKICIMASSKCNDSPRTIRAMVFISDIYRFVFEGQKWDSRRDREQPNRRICLCTLNEDGAVRSRLFNVNTRTSLGTKVKAKITKEVVNGKVTSPVSKIYADYSVYVPETVLRNHSDMGKRGQVNIPYPFEIWFNLGGPQLKDSNEEV